MPPTFLFFCHDVSEISNANESRTEIHFWISDITLHIWSHTHTHTHTWDGSRNVMSGSHFTHMCSYAYTDVNISTKLHYSPHKLCKTWNNHVFESVLCQHWFSSFCAGAPHVKTNVENGFGAETQNIDKVMTDMSTHSIIYTTTLKSNNYWDHFFHFSLFVFSLSSKGPDQWGEWKCIWDRAFTTSTHIGSLSVPFHT